LKEKMQNIKNVKILLDMMIYMIMIITIWLLYKH
jgi:hypothetical protein